jgi:hypothetical protein
MEEDELISMLKGRAKHLRSKGDEKTPDLIELAISRIKSQKLLELDESEDYLRYMTKKDGLFHVVACGNGERVLFRGSKGSCEKVKSELITAYLDGVHFGKIRAAGLRVKES